MKIKLPRMIRNYASNLCEAAKLCRVTVTDDHIAKGLRGVANSCPIALALRDRLTDGAVASVGGTTVMLRGLDPESPTEGPRYEFPLPEGGRRFVQSFDTRLPAGPFTFYAVLPTALLKGAAK